VGGRFLFPIEETTTMKTAIRVCLLALFSVVPAVLGADEENPLKKAKVGDWVEYKMTGPNNVAGKTKMTVVAKDDKEVTYEITGTFSFMGKETAIPVQRQTVDLTKPYDPAVGAANLKATGTKIEKTGEGKEKLKVGEKEFDTKWTKLKATTTVDKVTMVSEYQMWFAANVPLSGLVRMDTTVQGLKAKLELIGSGSK
jgi:hypothetical protein